jgi:hypothetical protein
VVAGTETEVIRSRRHAARRDAPPARRLVMGLLAGLVIAVGTGAPAAPAAARNTGGGFISGGGPSSPTIAMTSHVGATRSRPTASVRRSHSRDEAFFRDAVFERSRDVRRHRHRHRDEFADGFFPFGFASGFDWPAAPAPDAGDEDARRGPLFRTRIERDERPTVEVSPSGVTIIRGPGSHHISP